MVGNMVDYNTNLNHTHTHTHTHTHIHLKWTMGPVLPLQTKSLAELRQAQAIIIGLVIVIFMAIIIVHKSNLHLKKIFT